MTRAASRTAQPIRSRRLRARRREVRLANLRRWARRLVATLVIVATLIAGIALAGSSLFALDGVDVAGARRLTPARVRAAAGLRVGENVLRLDLGRAEERVEALPEVRSATVRRAGALRVRITVVERVPAVRVRATGGERFFDVDGVEVPGPARGRIPIVTLPVSKRPVADGRTLDVEVRPDAALVKDVLRVWAKAGDLRASIRGFSMGDDGVSFALSGARVVTGDARALPEKFAALRSILDWADRRGERLRSVDLRVPSHPSMRVA